MRRTCRAWYEAIDVTTAHMHPSYNPHRAMEQFRRLGTTLTRPMWKLHTVRVDVGDLGALPLRPICRFQRERLQVLWLYQVGNTFSNSEMDLSFLAKCTNLHTLYVHSVRRKLHMHLRTPFIALKTLVLWRCNVDIDLHMMPALETLKIVSCNGQCLTSTPIDAPNLHTFVHDFNNYEAGHVHVLPPIRSHSITRMATHAEQLVRCTPSVLSGVTHLYLELEMMLFSIAFEPADFHTKLIERCNDMAALECVVVDTGSMSSTADSTYLDRGFERLRSCMPSSVRERVRFAFKYPQSTNMFAPVIPTTFSDSRL